MSLHNEITRRRTFAIVSHPDAGKTTLTEKLLLYGGAVQMAGSVTSRKKERATVSDWLEIERKRGISVSSTILHFDYNGFRINLLDTPGHNDFSEDTYRVLTAVDSVIMVIDGGKGIEQQTLKLFEVCGKRKIPIITFINKMDRPSRDTLSLLDEIEKVLHIIPYPVNIPLGNGNEFKGIWDRRTKIAHLFERTPGGAFRAPVKTCGLVDQLVQDILSESTYRTVCDELEMIEHVGESLDIENIANGTMTPVFFGSAVNNFGVELLLDGFLEFSPPPQPRQSTDVTVEPESDFFSGFVFKIQANLDPKHRDRMSFIRIVSGKFTRDMPVFHTRTGKKLRLSNSNSLFGCERISVDEAWPGDVIGFVGGEFLNIGDTLCEKPGIVYREVPRFAPECFAYLHNPEPSNYKRFQKGLEQLVQEGLVHIFTKKNSPDKNVLLGAVGPLQFDLVQFRLESEYGAVSRIETTEWKIIHWLDTKPIEATQLSLPHKSTLVQDCNGRSAILFERDWQVRHFCENNPSIVLFDNFYNDKVPDVSVAQK
ncbi:MAG: peptide chain release factor 3 [Chitinispirillaceae bacterium]|nr:peptide chain release factor 3 [Chitinispirillaceae bacterium]